MKNSKKIMEVSSTFTCPCRPGFTYKSLEAHKKTKMHLAYEKIQEVKDVRVQSKQFENEIERLKNKLIQRELVEAELLVRIRILEESLSYYMKN
jgi:hypothetical protein